MLVEQLLDTSKILERAAREIEKAKADRELALANYEGQRRNTLAYAADLNIANERIRELESENARLREALKTSMTAIDDWLNLYASDICDEARVQEAEVRVRERGTLSYIAHVQAANGNALNPQPAPCNHCGNPADTFSCGIGGCPLGGDL
jgi:hypothetical protein